MAKFPSWTSCVEVLSHLGESEYPPRETNSCQRTLQAEPVADFENEDVVRMRREERRTVASEAEGSELRAVVSGLGPDEVGR